MKLDTIESTAKASRVAAHTHIKGLGLSEDGTAQRVGAGLVGAWAAFQGCVVLCCCFLQFVMATLVETVRRLLLFELMRS
jgi:DNA helicase TIP49 (TBP-interacting protein)